jgi:PAS domain S-box-containing protein
MKIMPKYHLLSAGIILVTTISVLVVGLIIMNEALFKSADKLLKLELTNATHTIADTLNRSGVRAATQAAADIQAKLQQKEDFKTIMLSIVEMPDERIVYHRGVRAGTKAKAPYISQMFQKGRGHLEFSEGGFRRYATFTTLTAMNWLVYLSIRQDEMLKDKIFFLKVIGGLTFLAVLLNSLIVMAFWRRILSRIKATLDCVDRIKTGDLSARIAMVEGEDEIRSLQDGVNAMSASIEERTKARIAAENALKEREGRIRRLFDANILGIIFFDVAGQVTAANDAFLAIIGFDREDLRAGRINWSDLTPEEFRGRDEKAIAELIATGQTTPFEKEYIRKDGSHIPVMVGITLFEGSDHEGVAFVLDLTQRKQAEEQQKLLLDELNHRVKNTLATVLAVGTQTLRSTDSLKQFWNAFESRLFALSQTHDLLTQSGWQGVQLHELLHLELAPHATTGKDRFSLVGPDLWLDSKTALTLGMVLHELATNAAKYGALSAPGGLISVKWDLVSSCEPVSSAHVLHLEWCETGGPKVTPPRHTGFGLRLIEKGLGRALANKVMIEFLPEGLRCVLDLSLAPELVQ